LTQSPPNERWAVTGLNEFVNWAGASAFYAGLESPIYEVPGVAFCCTTSAAFQQGLNQLIRQYIPDSNFSSNRPGLGHPKQINSEVNVGDAYQRCVAC